MAMAVESAIAIPDVVAVPEVLIEPVHPDINQILAQERPRFLGFSVSKHGSCVVTTNYFNPHPHLVGRRHQGITGEEIAVDRVSIRPVRTFMVEENKTLAGIKPFSYLRGGQRILETLQADGLIPASLRAEAHCLIDRITALTSSIEDLFNLT